MAYKVTRSCLRCGVCVPQCPEGAIIAGKSIKESDGLVLTPVSIDPARCNDCGLCIAEEYWCPAQAIVRA